MWYFNIFLSLVCLFFSIIMLNFLLIISWVIICALVYLVMSYSEEIEEVKNKFDRHYHVDEDEDDD